MQQVTDQVLIEVLNREFPEIYTKIKSYTVSAPQTKLDDLSKINLIIAIVDREVESASNPFSNWTGRNKIIHHRQIMVAVVMMFYNPKRLFSIVTREGSGLIKHLSATTGIKRNILSVALTKVISRIRIYEDFKKEVNRLYELVNHEHNLIN